MDWIAVRDTVCDMASTKGGLPPACDRLMGADPSSLHLRRRESEGGHFTVSLRVVDEDGRAVVIRHPKLGISTYPGGHIEGDGDLLEEARREFEEETGIDANLIAMPTRTPIAVGVHEIPASAGTPAHLHFDLLFEGVARVRIVDFPSPESIECVWCRDDELRGTYRTLPRDVRPDEYTF